ncbi:MAG: hypothetical protein Q6K99_01120 [Thermostichales cyanobacterium BF4_bins_65]
MNAISALVTEEYQILPDPVTGVVTLSGSLRLAGSAEYAPIGEVLEATVAAHPEQITIDLRGLEFLNSSGINMLSKFVLNRRQSPETAVVILGSAGIPWQGRSLKNLQRLLPSLSLRIE